MDEGCDPALGEGLRLMLPMTLGSGLGREGGAERRASQAGGVGRGNF